MENSRKNTLAGAFSPLLKKKARIAEASPTVQTLATHSISLTPSQSQNATPKKLRVEQAFEYSPMNQRSNLSSSSQNGANPSNNNRYRPLKKVTTFNDSIHGNIAMDGICLRIVDTKEFQRLRQLKQLGTCDYVYPGATHSRFSHSLGVGHYAEKVVLTLQRNQPYLNITEQDILCVKIAGLCHDLGHGPFSHVYDGVFLARMLSKKKRELSAQTPNSVSSSDNINEIHKDLHHVRHEDCSIMIFRHLLKSNNIDPQAYGLTPLDVTFIEEIIRGTPEKERVGRGPEKYYLYDVVNNSRSGLDVDKLDYFQRDIKHTNVFASYDQFERFIEFGRVMKAIPVVKKGQEGQAAKVKETSKTFFPFDSPEDQSPRVKSETPITTVDDHYAYMVCYPEKMVGEALHLFMLRYNLHQKVYTHKTVKKVELMMVDALEAANDHIFIPGNITESHPDGLYKMSECIHDAMALSNLSDNIVYVIESSTSEELKKSRELIERIRRRDFYSCLGKSVYKRGTKADRMTVEEITEELVHIANNVVSQSQSNSHPSSTAFDESDIDPVQPMEDEGYFDDSFNGIQSQDSFAPWLIQHRMQQSTSSSQQSSNQSLRLEYDDIIVEKMHIHYGMKGENPVNNVRFYPKDLDLQAKSADPNEPSLHNYIGKPVKESTYETLLPRVFEECAVRVFCRDPSKNSLIHEAYQIWCRDYNNSSTPFPTLSQQ